jgi:hypothetical protein
MMFDITTGDAARAARAVRSRRSQLRRGSATNHRRPREGTLRPRRDLSLLSIPGAGSLAGISAVTGFDSDNQRPKVLSLESLRVSSAGQMPRLHSYLERTLLPVLAEVHRGPKMLLEALVAPHTPRVLFLSAFASFDEMIEIRGKVASHPGIQRARAELESGAAVVEEVQVQILVATHDSLKFAPRCAPPLLPQLRALAGITFLAKAYEQTIRPRHLLAQANLACGLSRLSRCANAKSAPPAT